MKRASGEIQRDDPGQLVRQHGFAQRTEASEAEAARQPHLSENEKKLTIQGK